MPNSNDNSVQTAWNNLIENDKEDTRTQCKKLEKLRKMTKLKKRKKRASGAIFGVASAVWSAAEFFQNTILPVIRRK